MRAVEGWFVRYRRAPQRGLGTARSRAGGVVKSLSALCKCVCNRNEVARLVGSQVAQGGYDSCAGAKKRVRPQSGRFAGSGASLTPREMAWGRGAKSRPGVRSGAASWASTDTVTFLIADER